MERKNAQCRRSVCVPAALYDAAPVFSLRGGTPGLRVAVALGFESDATLFEVPRVSSTIVRFSLICRRIVPVEHNLSIPTKTHQNPR